MKKVLLNKFKKMLNEQKSKLLDKAKRLADNPVLDVDGDDVDEIQAKIIAHADAQIAARDNINLIRIESALKRIEVGTFGACEECGEDISEKRLLINPGFITCISCAEALELLKKRSAT